MSKRDVTRELPVASERACSAQPDRYPGLDDDAADRLLAAGARPLPDRPLVTERAASMWRRLAGTPGGAAAATAWGFALTVAITAVAVQPTVTVSSASITQRVSCGLDIYLYGYPDRGVQSSCRQAETVHLGLFIPAMVIVIAGLAAATFVALRADKDSEGQETGLGRLRQDRIFVGAVTLAIVAVVADGFAFYKAPVQLTTGGELVRANCGADSYFVGYPDRAIQSACTHAYSGHAHALIAATIVFAAALALILRQMMAAFPGWDRQRVALLSSAAVLAVVGVVALFPTAVAFDEAGAPVTVDCGIDTYLAGYPDHMVQVACRHHYGGHLLFAIGTLVAATACLVIQRYLRRATEIDAVAAT